MIMHWKTVEEKHAADRRERRDTDREFIADGEREHRTEKRLAADDQSIVHPTRPENHRHAGAESGDATAEGNPRHARAFHTHRPIETVNGKWRDAVPVFIAGVT